MAERPFCMREVPGSIIGFINITPYFPFLFVATTMILFFFCRFRRVFFFLLNFCEDPRVASEVHCPAVCAKQLHLFFSFQVFSLKQMSKDLNIVLTTLKLSYSF